MSNAWRDDGFYGQPWVRIAGPIAVALYQAAEDYCHRELSGAFVPRSELEIALPWHLRDGELDAAIGILERLGRFVREDDGYVLPRYAVEQEDDDAQASRTAQAKRAADARWQKQSDRRAKRRKKTVDAQPMLGASDNMLRASEKQGLSMSDDASVLSVRPSNPSKDPLESPVAPGPVVSAEAASPTKADLGPRRDIIPRAVAISEASPHETAMAQATRFMTTTPRNDNGRDRSWRFYFVRYVIETTGKPTYPTTSKHLKLWDKLLEEHGVEEFCRRVTTYFDRPPRTKYLSDGPRDFVRFLENFDLLAGTDSGTISRKIQFEEAGKLFLEQLNGQATNIAPEFLKLMEGSKWERPF